MSATGKTAVITGASRGIGAATAKEFAAAGANVALLARTSDEIETLATEIGERAIAVTCDVASYADVVSAMETVRGNFGTVDILVNNAGVIEPISHMATSDPAGWGAAIDINLKGVYHGMRAVLPAMLEAGGGTILTVSSGAAHGPVEAWSHYNASKAGAAMLTRSLHHEYGDQGIRAMGMSPGTIATVMQKEIKASGINPVSKLDWSDHAPPEWPAKLLLWMCSNEADPYLGQELSLRDETLRQKIGVSG